MKRHLSRKEFLSLGVSGGLGLIAAHCTLDDTPETAGSGGNGGSTGSTTTTSSGTAGSTSVTSSTSASGGSGGSAATSTTTGNGGSGGSGGSTSSGNGGNGGSGGTGGSGAGGKGGGGAGGSAGSGGKGGSGGSGGSKDAGAGGGGQDGGAACGTNVTANVSMNHNAANNGPHGLVIPAADIAAGVAKVYATTSVQGMTAQGHMHYVQVTAADFTALKGGQTVKKHSCSGGDHEFVLKCGGTTDMGGAPTCNDECGGMMSGAMGPCP